MDPSLTPFLILFGVLAFLVLAAWLRLREDIPPYEKRESLLTDSELRFYGSLQEAVDSVTICAMVRIADLIRVRPQTPKRQAWLNRILAKHIDFVLCDPQTMEALVAIELDDRSHRRPERRERDAFVDEAFQAAGLPLLRVPVQTEYDVAELRSMLKSFR